MNQVRIGLSKRKQGEKRHLVLRCDATYGMSLRRTVKDKVLEGVAPVVRYRGTDMLVLFNYKYVDRLLMTFPDANLSPGLRARLRKKEEGYTRRHEDVEVPGFQGSLYGFQHDGIAEAVQQLESTGVFMLNDEMGLGKTIQALAIILKRRRKRVLVVTTKSGCGAWARIIANLFPRMKYVLVEGNAAQRAALVRNNKVRITLVNFEALRIQPIDSEGKPWVKRRIVNGKQVGSKGSKHWNAVNPDLFKVQWDMIVVDEFHRCKNPQAQQTVGLLSLPKAEDELLMSGTPFLNGPLELWPALHRLWPREYPDYYSFERNLAIKENRQIVAYDPDRMIGLRDYLAAHSLRRRKDQVGIDMPEVIYSTVTVELTPAQRKLYNKIKDEFILLMRDGDIKNIKGALPQITRLKQACFSPELYGGSKHSAKVEELRGIVEELVRSGEKAIIFSQWEEACQILLREFAQYNPAYVTGSVTGYTKVDGIRTSRRAIQEDKFNKDESCHLYIGTIKANQEAITLSAGTYVIFTDKEWTPLANDQAIARSAAGGLRGINATGPVNVIELFAEDTFEERIERILSYKRGLFDRMVESDGGREDTRVRIEADKLRLRDIRDLL